MAESIEQRLNRMYFAVTNTMKYPHLQAAAGKYGYGPEKLAEGMDVYWVARNGVSDRVSKYWERVASTNRLKIKKAAAEDSYQRIATVAEGVFRKSNPAILGNLGFNEPMPKKIGELLKVLQELFKQLAKPDIAAVMAKYGFTADKLATERSFYDDFNQERGVQDQAKKDAIEATKDQNEKLEAMDDWFFTYIRVMAVAFGDDSATLASFEHDLAQVDADDPEVAAIRELTNLDVAPDDDDDDDPVLPAV